MLRQNVQLPFSVLALVVWTVLCGIVPSVSAQDSRSDVSAITSLMKATWEKPESTLDVVPVVVVGEHALAGWTQGDRGGRALLRMTNGKWAVVLCSGEPLKHESALIEAGVQADIAAQLARALHQAEQNLPREHVALFATFEGVVHMGDMHGHGAAHKH